MKNYTKPANTGFSMYTISGCKYCQYAKDLIGKTHKIKIINCDKYVQSLRERDDFYKFTKKYTIQDYKYFPMIFYNQKFIGGYKELLAYSNKV